MKKGVINNNGEQSISTALASTVVVKPMEQISASQAPSTRTTVYLGGAAQSGDVSWREAFLHDLRPLGVTVIDPTPDVLPDPMHDSVGHASFVQWERAAIDVADTVVFWLGDKLANQAVRVEIGYALGGGKRVLIGAAPTMMGREHLEAFADCVFAKSLDGLRARLLSSLIYDCY